MTHDESAAAPPWDASGIPFLREVRGPEGPPLAVLAASIGQISLVPDALPRLMRIAADPWSEPRDLGIALELDPILTLRTLHVLNSPAYGLRIAVADLAQAVELVGLTPVRDLAIAIAIADLFRGRGRYHCYDRPGLWQHMVAVAACSRLLAVRLSVGVHQNAFLAGLLHDVGLILLDIYRHAEFHKVIGAIDPSRPLIATERRFMPWDHTELGEAVGFRWRAPEFARAVMRWHHDPLSCPAPHTELAHCVAVANAICSLKGMTSVGVNLVRVPTRSLRRLGLRVRDVRVIADQLGAEVQRRQYLLALIQ